MFEVYKTIISKRDLRRFDPARYVNDETLHRILQAGRMAGSGHNRQPCEFIVVREPKTIAALGECGNNTQAVRRAPLVIIICELEGIRDFDAGRPAQNMMLTGWSEGIASCPNTVSFPEKARRLLGIPGEFVPQIMLAFGYPESGSVKGWSKRRPLEEIIHYEHWDKLEQASQVPTTSEPQIEKVPLSERGSR